MSAAIMHNTASLYDFGDFYFKNQIQPRSIWHTNNNTSATPSNSFNNSNTNAANILSTATSNNTANSQLLSNVLGSSMQSLLANGTINTAAIPITAANQQQQQHQLTNNAANSNGTSVSPTNASSLLNNNFNQAVAAATITNTAILQQHFNAVVAQQQQQQQQEQQKKIWTHNALTRAVSQPHNGGNVALMNTLIENLSGQQNAIIENIAGSHRKLGRTQSEPIQGNSLRYKTELCRTFGEEGECKYGEKCQFAHGEGELRNLQRHPKYKTEYCRTYHSVGICPYGPRCHFIHNEDEARIQMHLPAEYNRLSAAAVVAATAAQVNNATAAHPLPISPPLSPTNSVATFPFADQVSPANSVLQAFTFNTPPASPQSGMSIVTTPSPPPSIVSTAQIIPTQQQPQTTINHGGVGVLLAHTLNAGAPLQQHQMHGKQHSTSAAAAAVATAAAVAVANAASVITQTHSKLGTNAALTSKTNNTEESRLPVFNRLSSTIESNTNNYSIFEMF